MKRQPDKIHYLYGRLSNEDASQGDSYSIQNQRKMLCGYAEENGLVPYEFIFDDGYSGADFTRPEFCRMMDDVEAGKVAAIVVKDMSRFGRDYLRVGFLTDIVLPDKDVRLVAIHDNVDSDEGDNEMGPIRNYFNEWFVRSTSQKIRAVWQAKGKSGERLAVIPPYGYRKDPEDKRKLVVDDESAAVVRRIFRLCVEGHGPAQIARMMNEARLLNPSAYKHEHGILKKPRACRDPYFWNATTVHKILDAPEYLGHTVNFKTFTRSYKDKKVRQTPPEKQLLFEGTHPAIIDEETWEVVRRMRQNKRRAPRYGEPGLFSGVAFCADCGGKLYFHTRKVWNKAKTESYLEGSYSCAEYRKGVQYMEGGRRCTCHYIGEKLLAQLALEDLREVLQFVGRYEKQFVRMVMAQSRLEQDKAQAARKKKLASSRRRIAEIDTLIERLYVDNVSGKVPDERYATMAAKFEAEQAGLKEQAAALEAALAEDEQKAVNVDRFLTLVRKYTAIEELTPAIVHEFIEKIVVHEPQGGRTKDRTQKVEIFYANVGAIDCAAALEDEAAEATAAIVLAEEKTGAA